MANMIDCSVADCQNTIINCNKNENCSISCTETQSCSGSRINCPLFGDCNIECIGPHSCKYTTINATLSIGNFNLYCDHSSDHCKRIKIYASILERNINNNFNVSCNGPLKSCTNSEIHCPLYSNCFIECNADTSCKWSHIIGPNSNGNLIINCNGSNSCIESIFNGYQSNDINIIGCNNQESCYDLSLHCPQNINGQKHCHIQGNDNIGINLYAINGWNDIDIKTINTNIEIHHDGTMYCGYNYDISCDISAHSWTCINQSHCNFNDNIHHTTHEDSNQNNISQINLYPIDDMTEQSTNYSNKSNNQFTWWPFGARILFGITVIAIIAVVIVFYRYCRKQKHASKHNNNNHSAKHKVVAMNRLKSDSKSKNNCSDNEISATWIDDLNDLNNTFSLTPMGTTTNTAIHQMHHQTPMGPNIANTTTKTTTTPVGPTPMGPDTKARGSIDCNFRDDSTSNLDEGYQSESDNINFNNLYNNNNSHSFESTICKSNIQNNNNNNNIIEEIDNISINTIKRISMSSSDDEDFIIETFGNNNNNNNNISKKINIGFVNRIRNNSQSKSNEYCTISQISDNENNDDDYDVEHDGYNNNNNNNIGTINNFNKFNFNNNYNNYKMTQLEESETMISTQSDNNSETNDEFSDHKTIITAVSCTARTVSTFNVRCDSDDETICHSFAMPNAC